MRNWTGYIIYSDNGQRWSEEVDVQNLTYEAACAEVERIAKADYQPGWERIEVEPARCQVLTW